MLHTLSKYIGLDQTQNVTNSLRLKRSNTVSHRVYDEFFGNISGVNFNDLQILDLYFAGISFVKIFF